MNALGSPTKLSTISEKYVDTLESFFLDVVKDYIAQYIEKSAVTTTANVEEVIT